MPQIVKNDALGRTKSGEIEVSRRGRVVPGMRKSNHLKSIYTGRP